MVRITNTKYTFTFVKELQSPIPIISEEQKKLGIQWHPQSNETAYEEAQAYFPEAKEVLKSLRKKRKITGDEFDIQLMLNVSNDHPRKMLAEFSATGSKVERN